MIIVESSDFSLYCFSTIFIRANDDGVRGWAISDGRPCQDPNPVVGPLPELVHNEVTCIGLTDGDLGGFRVRESIIHKVDFVVHDIPVLLVLGWRRPEDANGSRVVRLTMERERRGSRSCLCMVQ